MSWNDRRWWIGLLVGAVIGGLSWLVLPLVLIRLGLVDMTALPKAGWLERKIGGHAFDYAMAAGATAAANPQTGPAAIAHGLSLYKDDCMICHGVPGGASTDIGRGLHPRAPGLRGAGMFFTPGELFWTIRNGVRMTGMPGFGNCLSDDQIWQVVAFVHHGPDLTDAEQAELSGHSAQAAPMVRPPAMAKAVPAAHPPTDAKPAAAPATPAAPRP